MKPVLYLLSGCTAAGKTALALDWAERNGAEIVSCDAMLFYRGMDIGTAKPSEAERRRIPHHLIDVAPVDRAFDVGRYAHEAVRVVASILELGRRPLIVGGSGFYLMSFLRPVVDEVTVDASARTRAEEIRRRAGTAGQLAELRRLNPDGLDGLDPVNPRRVSRALERCLASGKTLREQREAFRRLPLPFAGYDKRISLIDRDDEELRKRVRERAFRMVETGLIEEVRRLLDRGIGNNPAAARAIGYRETIAWLRGSEAGGRNELAERIAANTWKLVKKQRTWFRNQLPDARRVPLSGDAPPPDPFT